MEKAQGNRVGGPEGKGQLVPIESCAQDVSRATRQGTDHREPITGVIHDSGPGALGWVSLGAWNVPLDCIFQAFVNDGHARRIVPFTDLHVGGGPPTPGSRHGSPRKRSQEQVPVLGTNWNSGCPLATQETEGLAPDRGEKMAQGGVQIRQRGACCIDDGVSVERLSSDAGHEALRSVIDGLDFAPGVETRARLQGSPRA